MNDSSNVEAKRPKIIAFIKALLDAITKFLLNSCFTTVSFSIMATAVLAYAVVYQLGIDINGDYLFWILSLMAAIFVIDQIIKRFYWEKIAQSKMMEHTK
jgi:hypothetical protein